MVGRWTDAVPNGAPCDWGDFDDRGDGFAWLAPMAPRAPNLDYLVNAGVRIEDRTDLELVEIEDRVRERRRRASAKHRCVKKIQG
mgnify:CR=1 FL=1